MLSESICYNLKHLIICIVAGRSGHASSGTGKIIVGHIGLPVLYTVYCVHHGGIINGAERGGVYCVKMGGGRTLRTLLYIGEKDCSARFATGVYERILIINLVR